MLKWTTRPLALLTAHCSLPSTYESILPESDAIASDERDDYSELLSMNSEIEITEKLEKIELSELLSIVN